MTKLLTIVVGLFTIALLMPGAAAGPRLKQLGTDPAGDGPPALDVTYLQVGKNASNLEIRIGIDRMLPVVAGYPELPGIEWVFDVKKRRFIAEAVTGARGPLFFLFEEKNGGYTQLQSPEGTYDPADGYARILVPLKTIGAKSGVRISGADDLENGDVDAHVHVGPQTLYPDGMQTKKDYVVP